MLLLPGSRWPRQAEQWTLRAQGDPAHHLVQSRSEKGRREAGTPPAPQQVARASPPADPAKPPGGYNGGGQLLGHSPPAQSKGPGGSTVDIPVTKDQRVIKQNESASG